MASDNKKCYYPDGVTTTELDTPCNNSAKASACCGANAFCLDNGLCYDKGVISRGSCTDSNWQAPECAQFCKTVNPSGGQPLMPCQLGSPGNSFTCGLNAANCANGINTFTITDMNTIVLRPTQLAAANSAVGVSTGVSTTSATSSSFTSIVSRPTCTATTKNFTSGEMAGVGAGVGVPLLLAFLTALALLLKEKRRNRATAAPHGIPDGMSYAQSVPPYRQDALQEMDSGRVRHELANSGK